MARRLRNADAMNVTLAALVNLNKHPYYIHWGVIQISAANTIVIGLMILVFVLALFAPFPKEKS
jgi:fucose permease